VGQGQLNTQLGADGGTLAVSRNGAAAEFNDGAYEAEAQAGFTDSLRSLAPEGCMLVVGFTGGEIPTVKVNRLLLNNIEVIGVGWGAFWLQQPEYLREQWAHLPCGCPKLGPLP
jgi:NADPH:quinone reductase-like Zn-dependent oxidoreductase